jgi:hypothetical protein
MTTQTFYNTNQTAGQALKDQVAKCLTQEQACLKIYLTTRMPFTVSDILGMCERAGHKWIKVSIGRAVTNLYKKDHLVKTGKRKLGLYGSTEEFYRINVIKHPTKPLDQGEFGW